MACNENHQADFSTKTFALNQSFEVGDLRAIITEQLNAKIQVDFCFNSTPGHFAYLLPGPDAWNILDQLGYSGSGIPSFMDYMDNLENNTTTLAIHIETQIPHTHTTHSFLFIPNNQSDTNGWFIDLSKPFSHTTTCVSCVDRVGRQPPCSCVEVARQECGENPVVSCTSFCGHCPESLEVPQIAIDICGVTDPFLDSTPLSHFRYYQFL